MPLIQSNETKDLGCALDSSFGIAGARFTSADATTVVDVSDAPTTGQKLVVTDLIVSVDTAMGVAFYEKDAAEPLLEMFLPANGTAQITPRGKLKLTTANKTLQVKTSAAGNISVTPIYYSED